MAFEWHLSLSKLVPTPLLGITFHFTHRGKVLLLLIGPLLFSVVKLQEGLLWVHLFIYSASFTEYLLCAAGFPSGTVIKNPPASAGDTNSIPGEENGKSLQYSCLENSMDREAWWATVHGVTKSWTWLSTHTHTPHTFCVALETQQQIRQSLSQGWDLCDNFQPHRGFGFAWSCLFPSCRKSSFSSCRLTRFRNCRVCFSVLLHLGCG